MWVRVAAPSAWGRGARGGRYLSSACSLSCSSSTRASSCETLPLGFCRPSELAKRFFSSLFWGRTWGARLLAQGIKPKSCFYPKSTA